MGLITEGRLGDLLRDNDIDATRFTIAFNADLKALSDEERVEVEVSTCMKTLVLLLSLPYFAHVTYTHHPAQNDKWYRHGELRPMLGRMVVQLCQLLGPGEKGKWAIDPYRLQDILRQTQLAPIADMFVATKIKKAKLTTSERPLL